MTFAGITNPGDFTNGMQSAFKKALGQKLGQLCMAEYKINNHTRRSQSE
jgi:hypothetical protein